MTQIHNVDEHLLEWARQSGPRKVLAAARRRLEADHDLAGRPLRVDLTPEERDEVGRLFGITWVRSGSRPSARRLADAVAEFGVDVPALLAALGEPVRDLRAAKAAARQEAAAERDRAETALVSAGVPGETAASWLSRRGLPAAGNGALIGLAEQCAEVWKELPRPGGGRVLLTVLAARALDDPHALDRGSQTATAVLRLLGHETPDSAESWRLAWEGHGVDCDPVSSRVLVLNLRLNGDAPCARLTQAAGPEPLWLSLRSLSGTWQPSEPDADVYVCENPSVLIAAADGLGESSYPLVCTNGRPSAATLRLLTRLATGGTRLHVRADDDAAGQAIVAALRATIPGARLWRFDHRPPDTPRYEEQDLASLLHDLDRRHSAHRMAPKTIG